MPLIHLIPVTEGMEKDEVGARIQSGWVMAGRQAVNMKQAIVTPGNPMGGPTGIVDADVWVLPEPMMPTGQLAQMLYGLSKEEMGDVSTLNTIATGLLGISIFDLVKRMDEQTKTFAANTENLPGGERQDNPEALDES